MVIYWRIPQGCMLFCTSSLVFHLVGCQRCLSLWNFSKAKVWGRHRVWGGHNKDTRTCSQSYNSGLKWVKGVGTFYLLTNSRTLLLCRMTPLLWLIRKTLGYCLFLSLLQLVLGSLTLLMISIFTIHSRWSSLSTSQVNWLVGSTLFFLGALTIVNVWLLPVLFFCSSSHDSTKRRPVSLKLHMSLAKHLEGEKSVLHGESG